MTDDRAQRCRDAAALVANIYNHICHGDEPLDGMTDAAVQSIEAWKVNDENAIDKAMRGGLERIGRSVVVFVEETIKAFDAESAARIAELERERDEVRQVSNRYLKIANDRADAAEARLKEVKAERDQAVCDMQRARDNERTAINQGLAAEARLARAEEVMRLLADNFENGWAGESRHETIGNVERIARTFLAEQSDRPDGGDAIREAERRGMLRAAEIADQRCYSPRVDMSEAEIDWNKAMEFLAAAIRTEAETPNRH